MKSNYILASPKSFPSAKLLRDEILAESGERFLVKAEPDIKKAPVIRYGNSFGKFSTDTTFNSPEFISLVSNKKVFSDFLLESGIYAPKFTRETPTPEDFPIVIRQYMNACKGKGIIICKDMSEYLKHRGNFWTRFVPVSTEFGVHVLGGSPVKIFKKKLIEGEEVEEFPIRTSEKYHFSLVTDSEKFPKLREIISRISNTVGVKNFYRLDIGWDNKRKEYFVFEANSAPGLNELTGQLYAKYILENLGGS